MNVPLLDLGRQFEAIREDVWARLEAVAGSQRFIMGAPVQDLEQQIAGLVGARFGVGCASGTDALLLSLKLLNLQPGDEVITTPFTFFATAGAIHNAGGVPRFVDIDPTMFNIDPDLVEQAVGSRTRAIVPVHLYGQMAPMERIMGIAAQHGLAVIEDCAQAIGARRRIDGDWRSAGELGTTGAFSFFPSKNLGGWGDGGMIVTQDEGAAERLRKLRTHGGAKQYHHEEIGTNSRLDTIQAAVLLAKLPRLREWNAMRRRKGDVYTEAFAGLGSIVPPVTDPSNEHVFHQYTLRAERRDGLKQHLDAAGIGSAVYYPRPLHLQPCFSALGYQEGSLPEAERASREVLSIPIYAELTDGQQTSVIDAIRSFYG